MSKPDDLQISSNHQRSSVSPKKNRKRRQATHEVSDDHASVLEEGGSGIVGSGSIAGKNGEYGASISTMEPTEDKQQQRR